MCGCCVPALAFTPSLAMSYEWEVSSCAETAMMVLVNSPSYVEEIEVFNHEKKSPNRRGVYGRTRDGA